MTSVIVATSSSDLARRVRVAVGEEVLVFPPDQLPTNPSQVLALAGDAEVVRAVLVEPSEGRLDDTLRMATRFDQQFPRVSVILVTDNKAELALPAMRAGVRDLLYRDASVGDIRWALEHARDAAAARTGGDDVRPATTGRVVMLTGPKGGVGKTMLATNLAVGLTRHAPHGTALVDLNLQFGDVRAVLGLTPEATLADAAMRVAESEDGASLRGFLTRHRSGLQALCAAPTPAAADVIDPEHVGLILGMLKEEFQYVVLDTGPGLSEHTIAALEHVSDLVLVTGADVPSVRALIKELQVLDSLGLPMARHLVVNLVERGGAVTTGDIETAVGRPVDVVVPRSPKVAQAAHDRVVLAESPGRDPASQALERLVARFTPQEQRPGLWRRLTGRSR